MVTETDHLPAWLDVEAIRERSGHGSQAHLADAERRLREAERAMEEARRERDRALRERDEALSERDTTLHEKGQVEHELCRVRRGAVEEKKYHSAIRECLQHEIQLLVRRLDEIAARLAEATGGEQQKLFEEELARVKRQLDRRNRELFGRRSERRSRPDGDEQGEEERRKRRARRRRRQRASKLQVKLPIEEVKHTLPEEELEQGCPLCEGELDAWENQAEMSEEIKAQTERYKKIVHIRKKYRCRSCRNIVTAPAPKDRVLPGGRYSVEFSANVAWDKYCNHLPLNRQAQSMLSYGVDVSRQTLWDQLVRMYEFLLPTLHALHEQILEAPLIYADETTWRLMRTGETKKWWMWGISDGEGVFFMLLPTRGQAAARSLFQNYSGIVMADDYIVYSSCERLRSKLGGQQMIIDEEGKEVALPTPDYVLVSCWAHARRYLFNASAYNPEANEGLDLIGELYRVEDEASEAAYVRLDADGDLAAATGDARFEEYLLEERAIRREAESRGIVERFDAWRKAQKPEPGTELARALKHFEKIWNRLIIFLTDPRVPLDNNEMERQIRAPVQGRKNFHGSRSELGTEVATLFYSLFCSCKLLRVDPLAYLVRAIKFLIVNPGSVFLPQDFRQEEREAAARKTAEERAARHPAPANDAAGSLASSGTATGSKSHALNP